LAGRGPIIRNAIPEKRCQLKFCILQLLLRDGLHQKHCRESFTRRSPAVLYEKGYQKTTEKGYQRSGSNKETPPEAVLPGEIVPNQKSVVREELEEDPQDDMIPRAVPTRAQRSRRSNKTKYQLAEVETADEDHSLRTFFPIILIFSHFDKKHFYINHCKRLLIVTINERLFYR